MCLLLGSSCTPSPLFILQIPFPPPLLLRHRASHRWSQFTSPDTSNIWTLSGLFANDHQLILTPDHDHVISSTWKFLVVGFVLNLCCRNCAPICRAFALLGDHVHTYRGDLALGKSIHEHILRICHKLWLHERNGSLQLRVHAGLLVAGFPTTEVSCLHSVVSC